MKNNLKYNKSDTSIEMEESQLNDMFISLSPYFRNAYSN